MELLSTREVAAWLGVSEATIKRWSDAGMLACIRTPGGHRKFRKSDVRRLVGAAENELAQPVQSQSHAPTVEHIDGMLLQGDVSSTARLIQSRGMTPELLAETFDRILAPSLVEVGRKWASGVVSVADEHIASNTVLESLAQTLGRIAPPVSQAPVVALACVGNEQHDIGLRMVRVIVQSIGFATLLLGGSVPVLDLAALMNRAKPSLVLLSASEASNIAELRNQMAVLSSATRTLGLKLVVGGAGFSRIEDVPNSVQRFSSLAAFVAFARASFASEPNTSSAPETEYVRNPSQSSVRTA
jgi:MerR family transcriptional regulator, light-induced transcriptional regulator